MLNVYGAAHGCLTEFPAETPELPPDAVWIDLVEPTANEESKVEGVLGIDIPTREELAEIEASSRLYQEDGAVFMTANLIRRLNGALGATSIVVTHDVEEALEIVDYVYYLSQGRIVAQEIGRAHV